jgi:hypothetical protein
VHTETVPAGRASGHEVQGPPCAKDPSTAHRNHPVDGQPGESPWGSNATRNATTAVHTEPGDDHYISFCAGRRAEAEGFEPPVPLGTLAFKVVDPVISGDHLSIMGRSSTMHGHPWVLPITGECNHKCNHCGTPLGRPSPVGMLTDEGL